MNDFDYDVMQKKRIARGARHKKCGSKSRRCVMSTDYMTDKELQERNGAVMTHNMKAPMGWEELKKIPADLQQEYLQGLVDRFCVSCERISCELFKMSGSTLWAHIKNNGLRVSFMGREVLHYFKEDEWSEWLKGESEEPAEESEEHAAPAEPLEEEKSAPAETAKPAEPEEPVLLATNANFVFQGELNKLTLYKVLESLPAFFGKVRINIWIEQLEE